MASQGHLRVATRIRRVRGREGVAGQAVRYVIVASGGYLLAIACYSVELAVGISPYPALGVAFILNGLFNFMLLRVWAFPPSGRGIGTDMARFCVAAALSFMVNYAGFAVLYSAIGLHAAVAQRLAILIAAPVTFLANRLWSFRAREASSESPVSAREQRKEHVLSFRHGRSRR